jgi:uncharacterized protein
MDSISTQTARRYILGRQGLWPGRRWVGKDGAHQALRAMEGVQLDPLNITARSQDLALHSRVLDYQVGMLEDLMYTDRLFCDYGHWLFVYRMEEMPYLRVSMQRKGVWRRWLDFCEEHPDALDEVRQALRERGPLGNRDFKGNHRLTSYRARKDTGMALFGLWANGEIMTSRRQNFERVYDFSENVVPEAYRHTASVEEAEAYFARKALAFLGLSTRTEWRAFFSEFSGRKPDNPETQRWLDDLQAAGATGRVAVAGWKEPMYYPAADQHLLETLEAGQIPARWQTVGPDTQSEAVFLAPLDIVSARGRALKVFEFDYVWEVYKPVEQRRWGYYVLPVLYGDRLAARFDPKLDRKTKTLHILGFWLEDEALEQDEGFARAFAQGIYHFARFLGAQQVKWTPDGGAVQALTLEAAAEL